MAEKKTKTKKEVKEKKVNVFKNIIKPRVTEKSASLTEKNVYTFMVTDYSTKNEIKKEIEKIYKVKPLRVNVMSVKGKTKLIRGKMTTKKGGKKAVVFLKKGDKLELA